MLADELRKEVNYSLSIEYKNNLLNRVMSFIRGQGEFSMVCDDHIHDLSVSSAPLKYDATLVSLFKSEGFNVRHSRCCGVRHIDVTL